VAHSMTRGHDGSDEELSVVERHSSVKESDA